MKGKPPKPLLPTFKPDNLPEYTEVEELPQLDEASRLEDNASTVSAKLRPRGKLGRNFFTETVD